MTRPPTEAASEIFYLESGAAADSPLGPVGPAGPTGPGGPGGP